MINRIISFLFGPPKNKRVVVQCLDSSKQNISLIEYISNLECRIEKLEQENVELTNCLYEVENRLQSRIDNIHPVIYNFKDYNSMS